MRLANSTTYCIASVILTAHNCHITSLCCLREKRNSKITNQALESSLSESKTELKNTKQQNRVSSLQHSWLQSADKTRELTSKPEPHVDEWQCNHGRPLQSCQKRSSLEYFYHKPKMSKCNDFGHFSGNFIHCMIVKCQFTPARNDPIFPYQLLFFVLNANYQPSSSSEEYIERCPYMKIIVIRT